MTKYEDIVICDKCANEFIKEMIYENGSVDENRNSFYSCPYCGETYNIRLRSNEDVIIRPKS